ncbi:uncharacterized protein GGS22DRAFT_38666 [Annulohypoxylon maeteangense]|uniref:uncharacterized protein n=1 Tax=Annulohypoxylon maeteangense TaxID=1927788 RepID=UPI00200842AF|nr:uncharacterized protein GGS22DRAFT_38666 [Annulohypoxylon maeteangense]KAI0883320.1 hypothetical protein GGS22DRAFT_38666 [Annulohypoxylon maeteangense]
MATISIQEKAPKQGQLTVSTQLLAPSQRSPEGSLDIRRNSNVSTPCSAAPNGFDTDIEAIMPIHSSDHLNKTASGNPGPKSDCAVWPGQDHWRQKARAAKINNRSCQCMARLSQRNRIIAKVLIAFLIVGVAVGVGFGISKPLGAGIWQPKNH